MPEMQHPGESKGVVCYLRNKTGDLRRYVAKKPVLAVAEIAERFPCAVVEMHDAFFLEFFCRHKQLVPGIPAFFPPGFPA